MSNETQNTGLTFVDDVRKIIEQGRREAYAAAGQIAVMTYWHVGRRIVEEEQHNQQRAQYGKQLIKNLSEHLTREYGSGFSKRNLEYFRQLYLTYNEAQITHTCMRNPTIGVLLCTETDKTIARYSVLHNNEQLFASKYMAYMPTEEELCRTIEQQKRFFLEQHS